MRGRLRLPQPARLKYKGNAKLQYNFSSSKKSSMRAFSRKPPGDKILGLLPIRRGERPASRPPMLCSSTHYSPWRISARLCSQWSGAACGRQDYCAHSLSEIVRKSEKIRIRPENSNNENSGLGVGRKFSSLRNFPAFREFPEFFRNSGIFRNLPENGFAELPIQDITSVDKLCDLPPAPPLWASGRASTGPFAL